MKLSIIMPVLDETTVIEAALRALSPYRARGVELIVVDDGSTDATPDILARHAATDSRIRLLTFPQLLQSVYKKSMVRLFRVPLKTNPFR